MHFGKEFFNLGTCKILAIYSSYRIWDLKKVSFSVAEDVFVNNLFICRPRMEVAPSLTYSHYTNSSYVLQSPATEGGGGLSVKLTPAIAAIGVLVCSVTFITCLVVVWCYKKYQERRHPLASKHSQVHDSRCTATFPPSLPQRESVVPIAIRGRMSGSVSTEYEFNIYPAVKSHLPLAKMYGGRPNGVALE